MLAAFAAEGVEVRRTKRLFNSIAADIMGEWSEVEIKQFLYDLLLYEDLPEDVRAEALQLLQMAETALTTEQRHRLFKK